MRNHHHHLLCILSPSLSLLLLLFFSFSGSFHGAHSKFSDDCDPNSRPLPCGDVEIRYPFWMVTSDPDVHCGYPGFGLHCPDAPDAPDGPVHPTLSLMGGTYNVTSINYVNHTLTLVDMDVDTFQGCPRARHNLALDSLPLPLHYNSANVNLTFFFNCTAPLAQSTPVLAIGWCLRSSNNQSYVLVNPSPGEVAALDEERHCEDVVAAAAVKRMDMAMWNLWQDVAEAMREGFVLDWGNATACFKCEHSGGRCVVDEEGPLRCFCDDEKTHTGGSFCKVNPN